MSDDPDARQLPPSLEELRRRTKAALDSSRAAMDETRTDDATLSDSMVRSQDNTDRRDATAAAAAERADERAQGNTDGATDTEH